MTLLKKDLTFSRKTGSSDSKSFKKVVNEKFNTNAKLFYNGKTTNFPVILILKIFQAVSQSGSKVFIPVSSDFTTALVCEHFIA